MSLGGHIVGLANKKENDVERRVASIDVRRTLCITTDLDYMENSGLKYWWAIVVVKNNGSPRLLQNQHVYVMWKPLLWFVKGGRLRTLDSIADLIDSQSPRKVLHDDGQSPLDAEYVISKLTVQDDVVFDPLMGAARTGIAALIETAIYRKRKR